MKRIVALMLMFVSSFAHADCQDTWLEHHSPNLKLSVDYSDGCYHGKLILNYTKLVKNGPKLEDPNLHLDSIPFDRECQTTHKDKSGETVEFSCRKDGVSPLSGAAYRYKEFKIKIQCYGTTEPDIERSFICISGCGPITPKKLHMPWGEGCA
nr:hypothetical protein [Rhodoferax sp.]